jgi:hypothetical protein
MGDKTCAFCSALAGYKEAAAFYRKYDKDGLGTVKRDYTVALVIRSWTPERGKAHAGRMTDYRNRGVGYKLNFCPECGAELKRKRTRREEASRADEL